MGIHRICQDRIMYVTAIKRSSNSVAFYDATWILWPVIRLTSICITYHPSHDHHPSTQESDYICKALLYLHVRMCERVYVLPHMIRQGVMTTRRPHRCC